MGKLGRALAIATVVLAGALLLRWLLGRTGTHGHAPLENDESQGAFAGPEPSRQELYEQAQALGIRGRSKMNKDQLSRAVNDAERS
jgi:hypothetical protein